MSQRKVHGDREASDGHAAASCSCCGTPMAAAAAHANQPDVASPSPSPSSRSPFRTFFTHFPISTHLCSRRPRGPSSPLPANRGGRCDRATGAGGSRGGHGCVARGNPSRASKKKEGSSEQDGGGRTSALLNQSTAAGNPPDQTAARRLGVIAAQLVAGGTTQRSRGEAAAVGGGSCCGTAASMTPAARKASLSGLLGASVGGLGAATTASPPHVQIVDVNACMCTDESCSAEVATPTAKAPRPAVAAAAAGGSGTTTRPAAIMGARAKLPTRFGDFEIVAFECEVPGIETGAVVKGDVRGKEAVPVRLHSACFTGDLMGSLRCDCRDQLEAALEQIGSPSEECGAVVYLQQEGRGIGLVNKIKAYALQDKGMDTVEANHALGFADDLRTYDCAAAIVKALGCKSITLLSNNPKKAQGMEMHGVKVAAMRPLITPSNPHNAAYLATKKAKSGHIL